MLKHRRTSRLMRPWVFIAAIIALVFGSVVAAAPASAAPTGASCGFATGGGAYPSTTCWIDWSGYDPVLARSATGQDMTMPMGAYTVSFNVTDRPIPGWRQRTVRPSGSVGLFDSPGYYAGLPGLPVLYTDIGTGSFSANTLTIGNVQVTLNGAPVSGYSLVSASPETQDPYVGALGETSNWTSDQPIQVIDHGGTFSTGSGCQIPTPGDGTTSVYCAGASAGTTSAYGLIVSAPAATSLSASMYLGTRGEREGAAFGLMVSRVNLSKQVQGRIDSADSFDLTTAITGQTLGTASTGTADSATTGSQIIVPNGPVALSEAPTPGSTTVLDYYNQAWQCANATSASTTALPSGSGLSQSFTPKLGDDVSCTLTNSALPTGISVVKTADKASVTAGESVTYSFAVTNTGQVPLDGVAINEGAFAGSGTLSAVTCAATVLAPSASTTCTASYQATQADVDTGEFLNTASAQGTVTGTTAVVTSTPSTATVKAPGQAGLSFTKTANVDSAAAGDQVVYTVKAVNSGTLTLHDVAISEDSFTGAGTLGSLACAEPQPAQLAPGQELSCTVSYRVQAGDKGDLINTASANGLDPSGASIGAKDDAVVAIKQLVKPTVTPTATPTPTAAVTPTAAPSPTVAPTPSADPAPQQDELAYTGASGLLWFTAFGVLLIIAGVVTLRVRRSTK